MVVGLKLKEIQINGNFFRELALICGRTPHGVRGLKLERVAENEKTVEVALRMECVD